jgi:hypothetical protein
MVRPAAPSHRVNIHDIYQLAHLKEEKTFVWKRAVSKVSEMPQQLFGQRAARVNPSDVFAFSRNGARPRSKGRIRVENQSGLLDRHFDECVQLINRVQVSCVNGHRKSKNSWQKPGVISPPKEWRLRRIPSPALNIARPVHSFNQVPGWVMVEI